MANVIGQRFTLMVCTAAALTTSCAAPSSTAIPAQNAVRRGATALQPHARGALLYVSDTSTSDVYVFSYPRGKLRQTLTAFTDPAGECVDKSGNVFITNTGASDVVEYAHGGSSPIATYKDPGYFPVGCSVDPATGDLAVTNDSTVSSGQGDLVIYKNAKKRPKLRYTDASMNQMLLCGYDGSGNLFLDGLTSGGNSVFAELRRGASKLTNLKLDRNIGSAGAVQWDGRYVAIGDQSTNTIYRFTISGRLGKRHGSTPLGGATTVFQFWIDGTKVVGPDAGAADVKIWEYPKGGAPLKTVGGLYVPLGAAVSY